MDFSNFWVLEQEILLIMIIIVLFFMDIFSSEDRKDTVFYGTIISLFYITIHGFFVVPLHEYAIGGAFGGIFVSSKMTILMKNVLNIATLLVLLQTYSWLKTEKMRKQSGEFYIITLFTLLGMYIMVSAGNFMMLYIGMETASLPLACLAAYNKSQEKSAEAGVKFVLISALSSAVMLFGLSFLYGSVGTFYFEDMGAKILTADPLTVIGLVFFLGGLGFKLSLVPFHLWTADVYEGSPTSVTAYLSVVSKGAAAFALLFALYKVFGNIEVVWQNILWWLSIITITLGNLFAIRQKDIKRFFAFSSISQAGYILLGLIAGNAQGMASTVYYVLVYVFSNLAAFAVITSVENATKGKTAIDVFNGLYKSNPKLVLVMTFAVFSLGGIPPFAGFFSKFFIFMAAASAEQYLLVFIALLNTVVSLYYYLLIVKAMFIRELIPDAPARISSDVYNKVSMLLCVAGLLLLGIFGFFFYEMADKFSFGI
ncbi:MAG: NADH-quinone oxidoreductase subunit N [Dysgonamonadaceae bacterium]|jgi:NADH-quinone oxidoreductase subunit N|nr:NADH-quinone oxidoreductase subunit N [Dysgonamonadaceae bacterium]